MKKLEKDIEQEILIYLNSIRGTFAFKVNTRGYFDPKIKRYRKDNNPFLVPGTSDIICCHHGKFIAIEVKTPTTKKQTLKSPTDTQKNQIAFLAHVKSCRGEGIIVSSVDDVIAALATL